jgi:hypothetical protein
VNHFAVMALCDFISSRVYAQPQVLAFAMYGILLFTLLLLVKGPSHFVFLATRF